MTKSQDREREFEAVMREYGPFIQRIVRTYERDPHLGKDLLQDVAAAIWVALPRFRGDASLRTYIARVAHNRGVSHVAREARRRESYADFMADRESAEPGAHDVVEASDELGRLRLAVDALPLQIRQAVSLSLEGLPPREISAVLGISANAVSIRLTRAKKMLHDALGQERAMPTTRRTTP